MDPYSSPEIIPKINPFPHSFLSTMEVVSAQVKCAGVQVWV